MKILVLGGTGSIGGPLVRELVRAGHHVIALARSAESAGKLAAVGALPLAGDISMPEHWLEALPPLDAAIQVAAGFLPDDEAVERQLLEALLPLLRASGRNVRFVYTGGCWLFGPSGATVATEQTPFDPLAACAYSLEHIRLVLDATGIHPIVIHPAMVYEPSGGVFHRFHADATKRDAVRVVGSERVRWPLVHSEDLAVLFRLSVERSAPGESYLASAIDSVPVGSIARAFAQRFGTRHPDPEIISEDEIAGELGEWARGYARDQSQSGQKARRLLGWQPRHLDPESEIREGSDWVAVAK